MVPNFYLENFIIINHDFSPFYSSSEGSLFPIDFLEKKLQRNTHSYDPRLKSKQLGQKCNLKKLSCGVSSSLELSSDFSQNLRHHPVE